MMTYDDIVREIPHLTAEERKRLIVALVETLTGAEAPSAPKKRSILEFEGIAARLADDEDPQEYINHLRNEWDNHS